MWVKTTDGDKPGTIHYENQSTKIAITMRDSIWMLQSLNLHSISPIVFGNRNRELRIAFSHLHGGSAVFFAQLQILGHETRENSVSLKWHGQTVPILCPLKSSSFFDPAPTGDHATQQHARASACAARWLRFWAINPTISTLGQNLQHPKIPNK